MTTKDDVAKGFASVGGLIKTIGETIKETQRKKQVEKVLKQFQDPSKLFLNPDGTPKSDSEIAPMLNQGVMSLYQLGEDKLANSLTEYYSTMSKSFDKTSQNAFNYDVGSNDERFPKTADGKPVAFNERVDYGKFEGTKQFAPQQPKSRFTFQVVKLPGIDGSGTVKYYKLDKVTGEKWIIDESEYTKEIKESHYSGSNYNFSAGNEFKDQYIDTNGKQRTVVFKDGVPYDAGTQQKITDMTDWKPLGDLSQNNRNGVEIEQSINGTLKDLSENGIRKEGDKKYKFNADEMKALNDYIYGYSTNYPVKFYNAMGDEQINRMREQARDNKLGNWNK